MTFPDIDTEDTGASILDEEEEKKKKKQVASPMDAGESPVSPPGISLPDTNGRRFSAETPDDEQTRERKGANWQPWDEQVPGITLNRAKSVASPLDIAGPQPPAGQMETPKQREARLSGSALSSGPPAISLNRAKSVASPMETVGPQAAVASPLATPTMASPIATPATPVIPAPGITTGPVAPVASPMDKYTALAAQKPGAWQHHGLGGALLKAADVAGSVLAPGAMLAVPGTTLHHQLLLRQAAGQANEELGAQERQAQIDAAQFNTPQKRQAYIDQHPKEFEGMSDFEKADFKLTGKFPQREPAPKTERPENLDREAYDYYVSQGMTPADARKRVLQDAQSVKPERQTHTSAFEAFAYGSPEEKKAAQDYLAYEKKVGARYRTPNEFDEKFRLFKEDPETYKAMFGDKDKAGTPDRATATKMLNYFDRRRREIDQDFTLDEAQKQEQLKDIENLEKPFMDVVQPGAGDGPANSGGGPTHAGDIHRVRVIAPDGTPGSVPLRQLKAAKQKGYKVAP